MTDTTSLVKKQQEAMTTLKRAARQEETVFLLADTSGSMGMHLETNKRAIDVLREVVKNVRGNSDLPIIAFGGPYDCEVRFVDIIPEPDGGTPLHAAITLAKQYGATRLVVISDGMPDLREQSLENARAFGGQIDVVFIGHEGDGGSVFLGALAEATGGKRLHGDLRDAKLLMSTVIGLLDGDVEEPTIIQGEGFTTIDAPDADDADDDDADDDEEEDDDDDDDDEDDDE